MCFVAVEMHRFLILALIQNLIEEALLILLPNRTCNPQMMGKGVTYTLIMSSRMNEEECLSGETGNVAT